MVGVSNIIGRYQGQIAFKAKTSEGVVASRTQRGGVVPKFDREVGSAEGSDQGVENSLSGDRAIGLQGRVERTTLGSG